MTDNSEKRYYWGITRKGEIIFQGTHEQCWKELVQRFGKSTLTSLEQSGYKISRIK